MGKEWLGESSPKETDEQAAYSQKSGWGRERMFTRGVRGVMYLKLCLPSP
jgi:hypothetical protein